MKEKIYRLIKLFVTFFNFTLRISQFDIFLIKKYVLARVLFLFFYSFKVSNDTNEDYKWLS